MRTATPPGETATAGSDLEAVGLRVEFPAGRGRRLVAVDGVDISVPAGGSLGLVGESGCGKTTVARALVGLQRPAAGDIRLGGQALTAKRSREQRRAIQMIFQDPSSSLNPRMTVERVLKQLLAVHFDQRGEAANERVVELLDLVGLPASVAGRFAREMSGGQRQRVAIARALAVKPRVIVADEPTSALDVSVQATILRLFAELRAELGISLVFISHNLAATRAVCDRVDVMYLGRLVETATRSAVFDRPSHPYTKALMNAAPELTRSHQQVTTSGLSGELPSLSEVPTGCRLHPRCPRAETRCTSEDPDLAAVGGDSDHLSACHFRDETGVASR